MLFGAMNFPVVPLLEEIKSFAKLGFDYLELAMDQPMAHYSVVSENQSDLEKALKDNGLGIICHMPTFVSTADLTDSIRRASVTEVRRSLSVAADLGAKKIVLHPSSVSGMAVFLPDTARSYAYVFISEMLDLSVQRGISICLENMMPRNGFGVEPDEFEEIFQAFPSLKLTLDTGHANLNAANGTRLVELINRFGDRIDHVHLSDNLGHYDDHLPIGQGNIDLYPIIKKLQALGYDSTITFEVFDLDRMLLVESRERVKKMLLTPAA